MSSGVQTALGGEALESSNFLSLFTIFLIVCAIMYLIVIAALMIGILRRRREAEALTVEEGRHEESTPFVRTAFVGWTALIGLGLVALTIASFFTDRSNASVARNPQLTINVTANQWWWDVKYTTH